MILLILLYNRQVNNREEMLVMMDPLLLSLLGNLGVKKLEHPFLLIQEEILRNLLQQLARVHGIQRTKNFFLDLVKT